MLIFKGYNAVVEVLKDDAFYVLVSLHRYMKSKLNDKDHVFYHNKRGYGVELERKHKGLKCIMDRLQEIFLIEDENKFILKHWMYLKYKIK
jgi:hypothetical protein